jgi:hypothetical protein
VDLISLRDNLPLRSPPYIVACSWHDIWFRRCKFLRAISSVRWCERSHCFWEFMLECKFDSSLPWTDISHSIMFMSSPAACGTSQFLIRTSGLTGIFYLSKFKGEFNKRSQQMNAREMWIFHSPPVTCDLNVPQDELADSTPLISDSSRSTRFLVRTGMILALTHTPNGISPLFSRRHMIPSDLLSSSTSPPTREQQPYSPDLTIPAHILAMESWIGRL